MLLGSDPNERCARRFAMPAICNWISMSAWVTRAI